jgi:hypothetical protein
MVNFRVRSLDAMVAQLQKSNIEVKVDPEKSPYGRFARLHDPEGNPIELWEPASPAEACAWEVEAAARLRPPKVGQWRPKLSAA